MSGTVNTAALLERLMVAPPAGAAFDSVTEQIAVPPDVRLVGEQETRVTLELATREIEALAEPPL